MNIWNQIIKIMQATVVRYSIFQPQQLHFSAPNHYEVAKPVLKSGSTDWIWNLEISAYVVSETKEERARTWTFFCGGISSLPQGALWHTAREALCRHFRYLLNMESSGMKMSFWENGPKPGQFYSFPGSRSDTGSSCGPVRHTLWVEGPGCCKVIGSEGFGMPQCCIIMS